MAIIDDQFGEIIRKSAKRLSDNPNDLGLTVVVDDIPRMTIIDEVGNNTYIGKAAIASATGDAVWRIVKLTKSGGTTTLTYADGNSNFDNIWDNRLTLTYL